MGFKISSASFEDKSLGLRGSHTGDGQVLSLLFDDLSVRSGADDIDAAPQVRRAEGLVQCTGAGWVSVQLRGATAQAGDHGYAHATGWANGRRLRAAEGPVDEPFTTAVLAPVGKDGKLRLSVLLLAQRDLLVAQSGAGCWVDSIDIAVTPGPRAQRRAA